MVAHYTPEEALHKLRCAAYPLKLTFRRAEPLRKGGASPCGRPGCLAGLIGALMLNPDEEAESQGKAEGSSDTADAITESAGGLSDAEDGDSDGHDVVDEEGQVVEGAWYTPRRYC